MEGMMSCAEARGLVSHMVNLLHCVEEEIDAHADTLDAAPPACIEMEQKLLGLLLAPTPPEGEYAFGIQFVLERLRPEMFYREAHQCLYAAISYVWLTTGRVDLCGVTMWLRGEGLEEEAGGLAYLVQLASEVWCAEYAVGWCRLIVDRYKRREIIRRAHALIRQAEDMQTPMGVIDREYRKQLSQNLHNKGEETR